MGGGEVALASWFGKTACFALFVFIQLTLCPKSLLLQVFYIYKLSNSLKAAGDRGLADGPTAGGGAGPEAAAALPIPTALLPAAANQGHSGAL